MNQATTPPASSAEVDHIGSDVANIEPELTIVTISLATDQPSALAARLSVYVVAARQAAGCRNIDFCQTVGAVGRFTIIEKWASATEHAAHFEGPITEQLAADCKGLLSSAPRIELLESISAHDLH